MKISKLARRDAKALFNSCRVNGLLDEGRVRKAVAEVVTRKPRGYAAILSHFQRLVKLDIERRTARVESAVQLGDGLRQTVETRLSEKYGKGMNVGFDVNPALIGGLRVKVGSDVYDGSVKGRLAGLEASM